MKQVNGKPLEEPINNEDENLPQTSQAHSKIIYHKIFRNQRKGL
jgi:hypothetical protein